MMNAVNKMRFALAILLFGAGLIAQAQDKKQPVGQYNRILATTSLGSEPASDIAIREIFWPPGWEAPEHYHVSNLFIYVIEGEFEVITEHDALKLYRSGDTLRMQPETIMHARNSSDTRQLKLVVFQVGEAGLPFSVSVE